MRDEYGNEKHAASVTTSRQQVYATPNDAPVEVGKVLLTAAGAAGGLAALWVLVSEREKKQEPKTAMEQARAIVEEAARRARDEGAHAQASLVSGLEGLSADARKRGKASKKTAAKKTKKAGKKSSSDVNDTIEKITQFLKDAREEAATMVSSESDRVGAAAKTFRKEAGKKADDAKGASRAYSRRAKKDADRAKGEVAGVAAALLSRLVDAEHTAEGYVGEVLKPKVQELGQEAQGLLETGKARSAEIREKAESDVLPEARRRAEELRKAGEEQAKKAAEQARQKAEQARARAENDLIPEAKKRAEELGHTVEEQARAAKETLGSTASAVEQQASAAGEAVKRGGRETRSLLLWIALAGVLVFTVFLDEEQQKRLKEIAVEVFGEARDMYADMKGEDTSHA